MNYLYKSYITINTELGTVKGIHDKLNNKDIFTFYQIPYALPPVKSLRWKYPILWKQKYNKIYNATVYSKIPNQHLYFYYKYYNNFCYKYFIKKIKYTQTENCLYLDIYTPTVERINIPVVVCIYGGHYQYGYSRNIRINKEYLNNVLYITLNYRLGIFGFFQHPELKKENTFGNYGISDIICALNWIKNNIQSYGGDPNNITVEGQGSGANIILYLMCNQQCINNHLFHKAILHSCSQLYNLKSKINDSIELSDILVGQGRNQLLRLRNLDENIINQLYNNIKDIDKLLFANIDGFIIKNNPIFLFKNGKQMKIPIIIGYNYDDGKMLFNSGFNKLFIHPINNIKYNKIDIKNLNQIYKNINNNKIFSIKRYFTDFMFLHFNKLIAQYHTNYANTYFYILKHINITNMDIYCCFELDLLYFFNNNNSYNINVNNELKIKILKYINTFIISGTPNDIKNKLILWKEFENGLSLYFNNEIYMNFFTEYQSIKIMNKNYNL